MSTENPASRDQILDAAEGLFARKGFEATTIKEIGATTGLNPALLYYYFAGKEELYHAVLVRLVTRLVSRGVAALERPVSPDEAIRGLVATQVEFLLAEPSLPRIMIREMVDHEARSAKDVILNVATSLFQRLCRVIEEGQETGVFRPDVEPRFAAVSTISQVVYFIIARPAVGIFFGLEQGRVPDALTREFAQHAGEFAVRALSPSRSAA
jgi:TetR/AcrR family transcriptional regulator